MPAGKFFARLDLDQICLFVDGQQFTLFDVPDPILPAIDRKPGVKENGFVNRIGIKRGPYRKAQVLFISVLRIKFHTDMDQARFKLGYGFLDTGIEGLANLGAFGIF